MKPSLYAPILAVIALFASQAFAHPPLPDRYNERARPGESDRGSQARADHARQQRRNDEGQDKGPSMREIERVRGAVQAAVAQRTQFRGSLRTSDGGGSHGASLTAATAGTVTKREADRVRGMVQSVVAQRTRFRASLRISDGGSASSSVATASSGQVRTVSKREADRVRGMVQSVVAQRTQFRASLRTGPEADQKGSSTVTTSAPSGKDASEMNRPRVGGVEGLSHAQKQGVDRFLNSAATYVRQKLSRE